MAITQINVGGAPNDGTGDPHRTAFQKTNENIQILQNEKADKTEVAYALAGKADQLTVEGIQETVESIHEALSEKASTDALNDAVNSINYALAGKVNTGDLAEVAQELNEAIAAKASTDDLNAAADSINTALAGKVNTGDLAEVVQELETAIGAKADQSIVDDLTQTVQNHEGSISTLKGALIIATAEQIQSGAPGKLVDAAGLKNTIATQDDIEAGEAVKLVDAAGLKAHEQSKNAILYPNGGSEASPANIAVNSYYTMDNPFPGKRVRCTAELLYSGKWGQMPNGTSTYVTTGGAGLYIGLNVGLLDDAIVLRTAQTYLLISAYVDANVWNLATGISVATPLPCRVVVECIEA